uniref:Uncharacterized protein n=1 Tax=Acrobeloides nanus TaxID=290746 RepID=A0A914D3A2_9BILA
MITICIGFSLSCIDVIVDMVTVKFQSQPGCAAAGCFRDRNFEIYWSVTNAAIGIFDIGLTGVVAFELKRVLQQNQNMVFHKHTEKDELPLKQRGEIRGESYSAENAGKDKEMPSV